MRSRPETPLCWSARPQSSAITMTDDREKYADTSDKKAVDCLHDYALVVALRMCLWRVPDCAVDAAEVRCCIYIRPQTLADTRCCIERCCVVCAVMLNRDSFLFAWASCEGVLQLVRSFMLCQYPPTFVNTACSVHVHHVVCITRCCNHHMQHPPMLPGMVDQDVAECS